MPGIKCIYSAFGLCMLALRLNKTCMFSQIRVSGNACRSLSLCRSRPFPFFPFEGNIKVNSRLSPSAFPLSPILPGPRPSRSRLAPLKSVTMSLTSPSLPHSHLVPTPLLPKHEKNIKKHTKSTIPHDRRTPHQRTTPPQEQKWHGTASAELPSWS